MKSNSEQELRTCNPLIQKHESGHYELVKKPTQAELEAFYQQRYFDSKNFEVHYSEDEQFHKSINFMEAECIFKQFSRHPQGRPFRFLDFGCGEGFGLQYFFSKNWEVFGSDYSRDGIQRHFPHLSSRLWVGDSELILQNLIREHQQFDLIVLNNVLEHLLEPLKTLQNLSKILHPQGILRVQVPNDFSNLQINALAMGKIEKEFWIAPHEHMSYFNKENLPEVFRHAGLNPFEVLGDFPIDFNLFNDVSNYIQNPLNGKACHHQRLAIDNMLARQSAETLVAFRKGCGQAGVGRNIIVYGHK